MWKLHWQLGGLQGDRDKVLMCLACGQASFVKGSGCILNWVDLRAY